MGWELVIFDCDGVLVDSEQIDAIECKSAIVRADPFDRLDIRA